MKPGKEPLLFRPKVFYTLAGLGLLSGIIGLAVRDTVVGWWVGFLLACFCLFGTLAAWATPVAKQEVSGA